MHLGHITEEIHHRLQRLFIRGDNYRRAVALRNRYMLDFDQHWKVYVRAYLLLWSLFKVQERATRVPGPARPGDREDNPRHDTGINATHTPTRTRQLRRPIV